MSALLAQDLFTILLDEILTFTPCSPLARSQLFNGHDKIFHFFCFLVGSLATDPFFGKAVFAAPALCVFGCQEGGRSACVLVWSATGVDDSRFYVQKYLFLIFFGVFSSALLCFVLIVQGLETPTVRAVAK